MGSRVTVGRCVWPSGVQQEAGGRGRRSIAPLGPPPQTPPKARFTKSLWSFLPPQLTEQNSLSLSLGDWTRPTSLPVSENSTALKTCRSFCGFSLCVSALSRIQSDRLRLPFLLLFFLRIKSKSDDCVLLSGSPRHRLQCVHPACRRISHRAAKLKTETLSLQEKRKECCPLCVAI